MSDQGGATSPDVTPGNGEPQQTPDSTSQQAAAGQEDPRVAEARAEAISERHKRQEAEAKVKEYEDAKLSDQERTSQRVSELEAENGTLKGEVQSERLRTRVASIAVKAGVNPQAVEPDEVWKLLDMTSVDYDEDGKPKNLDSLVEKLKRARPALFAVAAPGSFDQGPRGDAPRSGDMNSFIRQGAQR